MTQETEPPDIPYADWAPTKETLHLYVQLVDKVRLASTHPRNHWWHVPLYVDVRGLTTRQMRLGATSFDLSFDFLEHQLVLRTDRGESASFALEDGLSVAEFDASLRRLLDEHELSVAITRQPFGLKTNLPFPKDREHSSYDADAVARYWRALQWVDGVLDEFASWFSGKASPVHLFWHSLDLAYTRFSGRPARPPAELDPVTREAYSHEVISFGFWAGDDAQPHPSFYSYTAPEPPALTTHELAPVEAQWQEGPTGSLALLPYDVVRASPDPRSTLLGFLQSAYEQERRRPNGIPPRLRRPSRRSVPARFASPQHGARGCVGSRDAAPAAERVIRGRVNAPSWADRLRADGYLVEGRR